MLTDSFGRPHTYLRISLTDVCNFRCLYCMPDEDYAFLPREKRMEAREIGALASVFCRLGINKIRLTGGEPLVRKDFPFILELLSPLGTELLLTTNGLLLRHHLQAIQQAGIRKVNVSLDSLRPETFARYTQRPVFQEVWDNILHLLEHNFQVKINVVAIKDQTEKELFDFLDCTRDLPLDIRFIELMPFEGNGWNPAQVITSGELLQLAKSKYMVEKMEDKPHSTSQKYKIPGHAGTFAFIPTMSQPFCGDCNRLRLTADGKIKNCLFGREELDLLGLLRSGGDVEARIRESISRKHARMGGQFPENFLDAQAGSVQNRSMIRIGG